MNEATETPGPGVYPGTPFEVYHGWEAASNTVLGEILRSPAHGRAKMDEKPVGGTPARVFGSALHCAVLEPGELASRYVTADQCGATLGSGKRAGERCTNAGVWQHRTLGWVCGSHVGATSKEDSSEPAATVLSGDDMKMIRAMQVVIRNHPSSGVILDGKGPAEASIIWTDPETGAPVKIRPDWIAEDVGAVVDLKTCQDASPEAFQRDFFNYGYHRQAWLYLTGCQASGFEVEHYTILAVEKSPPFATAVYRVRDDVMEWAEKETRPLLDLFASCMEVGRWPAYPPSVQLISLPAWAYDRIEGREDRVRRMAS